MKFRNNPIPIKNLVSGKIYYVKSSKMPKLCFMGKVLFTKLGTEEYVPTWGIGITSNPLYTSCVGKEIAFSKDFMWYDI